MPFFISSVFLTQIGKNVAHIIVIWVCNIRCRYASHMPVTLATGILSPRQQDLTQRGRQACDLRSSEPCGRRLSQAPDRGHTLVIRGYLQTLSKPNTVNSPYALFLIFQKFLCV